MSVIPSDSTCCGVKPLIAACVATGMNVGSIVTPSVNNNWIYPAPLQYLIRTLLTGKLHSANSRSSCVASCNDFELHVQRTSRKNPERSISVNSESTDSRSYSLGVKWTCLAKLDASLSIVSDDHVIWF
jgi:hypothetical protein